MLINLRSNVESEVQRRIDSQPRVYSCSPTQDGVSTGEHERIPFELELVFPNRTLGVEEGGGGDRGDRVVEGTVASAAGGGGGIGGIYSVKVFFFNQEVQLHQSYV